jgi:hypothetical protein
MPPPLYAARIEDLKHYPTISIECADCWRRTEMPVSFIRERMPAWERVLDIPRVLRCDGCGSKGRAVVDARRALGYER